MNLARGVARKRERQVVLGEARAVVVHLHALDAALIERHLDFRRAGIERVLEQLLQDGCGPLDHFARRDLADQQFGQDADPVHAGAHAGSI
jgi:hypothetical protein